MWCEASKDSILVLLTQVRRPCLPPWELHGFARRHSSRCGTQSGHEAWEGDRCRLGERAHPLEMKHLSRWPLSSGSYRSDTLTNFSSMGPSSARPGGGQQWETYVWACRYGHARPAQQADSAKVQLLPAFHALNLRHHVHYKLEEGTRATHHLGWASSL